MFSGPPGTDEICEICFWQDDASSLRYATIADGPNKVSLIKAQRNYSRFGACEERLRSRARVPRASDKQDPTWRPIDTKVDVLDTSHETGYTPWPEDKTELYYWRDTYWLKKKRGRTATQSS